MTQTIIKQNKRVGAFLQAVTAEVEDLPALDVEWPALYSDQRANVFMDWDHLMADYLMELEETYHTGAMTNEQAAEYRHLLSRISENLPIFERLELRRPMVRLPR